MGKRKTNQPKDDSAVEEYRQLVEKKESVKKAFHTFQINLPDLSLDYINPDQRHVIPEGIEKLVKSYESTGVQADKQPISVLKKTYAQGETMPKTLGERYLRSPASLSQSRQRYLVVNGQHRIKALMRFDEEGWPNRTWNANCYDEEVVSGIHPEYMAWLCENLEVTQGIATSVTDKVVALRAKGYEFCVGPGLLNYMLANATEEDYKIQSALQSRMRVLATFPEKGLMPRDDPKSLKKTCNQEEFANLGVLFKKYLKHIGSALMLDYSKTFGVLVLSSYQVAHFSLTQMTSIIRKPKNISFLSVHKLFEYLPRFLAVGFVACEATLLSKEMSGKEEGMLKAQVKNDLAYVKASNPFPESFLALFKAIEKCYFKQLQDLVADMADNKLAKAGNFEKQGQAQTRVSTWFRSIAPVPVLTDRNTEVTQLQVEHNGEVISEVNVHIGDFFQWALVAENADKYPFVFGDVPYFVTDRACDSIGESMKIFPESERKPRNFVEKVLTALKKITKKDAQVILYCSREQQILFGELCKDDEDFRAFDLFVNYGKSTVKSQMNRTYNCTNVFDYAVQLIRGSPSWTNWGCAFDSSTNTSVDIKMMPNAFESKDRPNSTDLRPFPKDETLNGRFIEYFAKTEPGGLKHPVLDIFAGSGSMIIPAALARFNLDLVELEEKNVATYQKKVQEANIAVAKQAEHGNMNLIFNRVKARNFRQAEITQNVLKRKRAGDAVVQGTVRSPSPNEEDNARSPSPNVEGSARSSSPNEEGSARSSSPNVEGSARSSSSDKEGSSSSDKDVSAEKERGDPKETHEVESAELDVSAFVSKLQGLDFSNLGSLYSQEAATQQAAAKQVAIRKYKKSEKRFLDPKKKPKK